MSGGDAPPAGPRRILYGRRRGHRLRAGQQALLDTYLPHLGIGLGGNAPIDPLTLFSPPTRAVVLEIGFGSGEHLAGQAVAHPDWGFIGCEPFVNGLASFLRTLDTVGLENVRLFTDDARLLMARLEEASLSRIDILFPDPWHKTRHHKRRLISIETVADFARLLADRGEIRFATDVPDYARWTLKRFLGDPAFLWPARRKADWARPEGADPTRYERKSAARGRDAIYLRFVRDPRLNGPASKGP